MVSSEVFALILSVLTSWEVVAVTVALVLYLFLVFYVARLNRRRRPRRVPKAAPPKKKEPEIAAEEESEEEE